MNIVCELTEKYLEIIKNLVYDALKISMGFCLKMKDSLCTLSRTH